MPLIQKVETEDGPKGWTISASTPIALGMMVTILASIAMGAWKMSAIAAKLDNIAVLLAGNVSSIASLERQVADHKADDANKWSEVTKNIEIIRASGSPRLQDVEKHLVDLDVRFGVHEALSKQGGKP